INVGLVNTNGSIRFTIQDHGVGMDEQTKARIFEKFFQGDISHTREGIGLGLAIVKRIVELSGGTIEVKSTLGKGSGFTVTLPNECYEG
ncbi:MAG: HAMP domain-containing histidine kinase, partial [Candidatus Bathyarchaeota archaeon]|nr:HAMP domain-containing histidine kinase [Candidatus Bathyarchaeota archaeon]